LKPEEDRAREGSQKFEGGEVARDSTFCRRKRKTWALKTSREGPVFHQVEEERRQNVGKERA
jgi:hypothetical protein